MRRFKPAPCPSKSSLAEPLETTRAAVEEWKKKCADVEEGKRPPSLEFKDTWGKHANLLASAQQDLCAYCERILYRCVTVDHYRPKASVSRRDATKPRTFDRLGRLEAVANATIPVHDLGYWWLAHEWSNWLVACDDCNLLKSTHFPVSTHTAELTEGCEASEAPLILDPRSCEPSEHFAFSEFGLATGLTDSGRETLLTLLLNEREDVLYRRKQVTTLAFQHCRTVKDKLEGIREHSEEDLSIASHWLLLRLDEPDDSTSDRAAYFRGDTQFFGVVRVIAHQFKITREHLEVILEAIEEHESGRAWA